VLIEVGEEVGAGVAVGGIFVEDMIGEGVGVSAMVGLGSGVAAGDGVILGAGLHAEWSGKHPYGHVVVYDMQTWCSSLHHPL